MINLLKQKREEKGISQDKLSKLSEVTLRQLQNIEKGNSLPRLDTAYKICNALGLKVEEVFMLN